jgi:hypothetical protein
MRLVLTGLCFLFFISCGSSIKLAVPEAFKSEATMLHVSGARGNKMAFGSFTSTKIKRGMHYSYPGWSRGFLLENLLLNRIGIQKDEVVKKEKDRFRYSLSDGQHSVEVFGKEMAITRSLKYKTDIDIGILKNYERLQEYRYLFLAVIAADTLQEGKNWDLLMTNAYDRTKDTVNSLFTILRQDDNGLATNGKDTIFIRPLSIKKTEAPDGRMAWLPIKLLSGYELSTAGGVVAVIDLIDRNVWLYNELDAAERLTIGGIATALFARRVNDTKW